MESSASGGLSLIVKNQIYTEVAPKKKNRIYGVGNMQAEASSAQIVQPPPPSEDPLVLAAKLAAAEAVLATQATQLQANAQTMQENAVRMQENELRMQQNDLKMQENSEKMHSYDAYFDYLASKDPEFAARFRREDSPARHATGDGTTGQ
ncbi:PREDICTED: uncharacterized protein LOC104773350 [Camelina sativa]|uniref:Uncharacterized protein LOC104757529 n=1 Tax=Camelina sativa TaxID=90675 RepID=A0ABM0Y6C9_CAMSA|nr:PREDICTED: uncharacterized protein LOC104757529 [Camelina sativa]XP_010496240.1 PREDICTED: uncharacterized protein LOC104773350 [Camelina sativa]